MQTAVTRVQQVIATNRARKRLHPRMRHPKRGNDLNARMLSWPNWHELLNKTDGQGQPPPRLADAKWGSSEEVEGGIDEEEPNSNNAPAATRTSSPD